MVRDGPSYISFPFLFALSIYKEAWVANLWELLARRDSWNPNFDHYMIRSSGL